MGRGRIAGDRIPRRPEDAPPPCDARVLTAGYEGRLPGELLDLLRRHGVHRLVDVREIAVSRRPGFSAEELREAAATVGADYWHLKTLGCDRDTRRSLRLGSPPELALQGYRRRLVGQREALAELTRLVRERPSLILCMERDPRRCHRSVLADYLVAEGADVRDL